MAEICLLNGCCKYALHVFLSINLNNLSVIGKVGVGSQGRAIMTATAVLGKANNRLRQMGLRQSRHSHYCVCQARAMFMDEASAASVTCVGQRAFPAAPRCLPSAIDFGSAPSTPRSLAVWVSRGIALHRIDKSASQCPTSHIAVLRPTTDAAVGPLVPICATGIAESPPTKIHISAAGLRERSHTS